MPCVAVSLGVFAAAAGAAPADEGGAIRYREIEYQRMPLMSYLAFDDKSPPDARRSGPSRAS